MTFLQITSPHNALYKTWAALLTARGVERNGLALVSGRKIVPELLAEPQGDGATLIVPEGADVAQALPATARGAILSKPLFDKLDELGTGAPLLVVPVPAVAAFNESGAATGLVIGVAAQDPSNLGAILRSALAFAAAEVVLLAECAHPFLPRVTRAASGANFRLKLSHGPGIRTLREGWVALDMEGEAIDAFAWPADCRLLLGEEGLGVPAAFAGARVRIPISPRMESLNVAVSAGIALAAYRQKHPLV